MCMRSVVAGHTKKCAGQYMDDVGGKIETRRANRRVKTAKKNGARSKSLRFSSPILLEISAKKRLGEKLAK